MKKKLTLIVAVLFTAISFAQTKPPTITEANRDTLYPEIYHNFYGYIEHFQHPATPLQCIEWGFFSTTEQYAQYLWEVEERFLPDGGDLTDTTVWCVFDHSGYLKVTVWDSLGNSGTDSIWFNIKDWTEPFSDFTMEIDSSNHAVFSATVTPEQTWIGILRSLDTINWLLVYDHHLSPGHWSWRDEQAHFSPDSVWNYIPWYVDSCDNELYPEMTPGMMMGTQPAPGGGWYLTFHTVLQGSKSSDNYVYPIFTIDQDGVRHELYDDDGEPVILPASANSLLLKKNPDAYYQGAVAKLSSKKDDGYEILSYSNQVVNPLPDTEEVSDVIATPLKIYPNPSHGTFTVEGVENLTVFNTLGQAVATSHSATGTHTFTLRSGLYFVKSDEGTVQKVVVE